MEKTFPGGDWGYVLYEKLERKKTDHCRSDEK